MSRHRRSGGPAFGRLSLPGIPSIRVSLPHSAFTSPRSSTGPDQPHEPVGQASFPEHVDHARTGKEGQSATAGRIAGKRYASDIFGRDSTIDDASTESAKGDGSEPFLPAQLVLAIQESMHNCAQYERQCEALERSITSKAEEWRNALEVYDDQDHSASNIQESVSHSASTLEAASSELAKLIEEAHAIDSRIPPVRQLVQDVEEDVKGTLEAIKNLKELLAVEQTATMHRQAANARARRRSGAFYVFAVFSAIFAVYWLLSNPKRR